ncbi:MAG: SBBP repeat-containing protein [Candidatus Binataceae bacterium]
MNIAKRVIAASMLAVIAAAPAQAKGLKLRIKPKSLSFGKVMAGTTSAAKIVTLSNRNSVTLSVGPITASAPFAETDDCTPSIAAGGSCQISVTFRAGTPSKPKGTKEQGSLTISDDAAKSPQTVKLKGIAFGTTAAARIFVTDSADYVVAYPLASNGNVAPSATITGSNTGLANPYAIAVDSSGNVYVANCESCVNDGAGPDSVDIYPAGSNGNVAPISTITGSNTGLDYPYAIAVDSSGNVYVANCSYSCGLDLTPESDSITVYPAGSNGNAAPIATITGSNTGLYAPLGIAVDSSGNVYVANVNDDLTFGDAGIVTVYPTGSNGNVAPIAAITDAYSENNGGSLAGGIAVDSSGNVYVANCGICGSGSVPDSIDVLPAGSNGNVVPSASIAGSNTGLSVPTGVALDSSGNIYVLNFVSHPGGAGFITVYPAGSNGNAAPSAMIVGPATDLTSPAGIAVGP